MKLFLVDIIFLLFLYNFESVLGFLHFPREAFDITYEDLLVESKERPFIDLLQIFRIEIPFGKSYIWSLLYQKCPATRMGLPGTCHCDVTKADH